MIILHIDMDAFYAAIEERENPSLKGKAIAVGSDPKGGRGRGVVSTANYEARKYGIHSAQPISWAYRANPQAVFLPVDMHYYGKVSQKVMVILSSFGKIEQVSIDEAYIEIDGDYKKAEEIAQNIKKEILEKEKLTCSIGVGPNKLIAKIASDHQKPDGLTIAAPDKIHRFLDPKTVRVLPGVGPKTEVNLKKLNVEKIKDLRKISRQKLEQMFGKNGVRIWEMAQGIDRRKLEDKQEVKSVGRQETFEKDLLKPKAVITELEQIVEKVFDDLKKEGLKGKTIAVIVRYSDFQTYSSQKTEDDFLTFEKAKKIALQLLLPYLGKTKGIRLIGIRITNLD